MTAGVAVDGVQARANHRGGSRASLDLSGLNPPQLRAVLHGEGPLLVLAGAGSGKTRVIIYRIARLLGDGVPPEHILGMTFTNKAAREMRQRLRELAGRAAARVTLSTFHALGLSILKEEHRQAGLGAAFAVYDTADQLSLVRELMRQTKVADRRLDAARVLDIILRTKRERRDEVELDWGDDYELAAFDLYPRYVAQMRAFNAIDFDDLILRSQDVLQDPHVRARWQKRFAFLLVDEYQDTSPDQLQLVNVLAGSRQNVCAVGDDDQAIYAWRGAAVDNILNFSRQFPGTVEVVLDQNYRSTGHILAAANAIIRHNTQRKAKSLWSGDGPGAPVEVVACRDEEDEAIFVCETIARLRLQDVPLRAIAVLYRSNVQSRIFEEHLRAENLPFRVVGGQAFYDRKEVRDVLAYLSVVHNEADEVALRRIVNTPPRGIGAASLERLAGHAAQQGVGLFDALRQAAAIDDLPRSAVLGAEALVQLVDGAAPSLRRASGTGLADDVRSLVTELRLKDAVLAADDSPGQAAKRLENLAEVQNSVERFCARLAPGEPGLQPFLRAQALVRGPDEDAEANDELTLMTLHSAKGLEFPHVLLVGVEEELLPHRRSLEEGGELSEERRLCYVGITRARRRLWLSYARQRRRHGKMIDRTPSRFLQELPEGEGIKDWERDDPPADDVDNDALAQAFFKKMRAQLGIED